MIGSVIGRVRQLLGPCVERGIFGSLELHAAERIASAVTADVHYFDALSVASAVWATQQGHVCFDVSDTRVWDPLDEEERPDTSAWISHLRSSPIAVMAESWDIDVDGTRPLVVHGQRIYLARQWIDEAVVADRLHQRRKEPVREIDLAIVDSLFEDREPGDSQHRAVVSGIQARTSILTGGPGTGKTYTIARILVAAVRHGISNIALAAPTAKAAVQMRESLMAALSSGLPGLEDDQRLLLERLEPTTIHRLLGSRSDSTTRFRYGRAVPLPYEFVVVDEMSMVSLPLMARLLEAIDPSTSLVMVGDPDQLDSVENGSILRDLTAIDLGPTIPITVLEQGRRNAGTRSSSFADAVRLENVALALDILTSSDTDDSLTWMSTSDPLEVIDSLDVVLTTWRSLARYALDGEVDEALGTLFDARVLCPHREGPFGVEMWNARLATAIAVSRDRWRAGDIVIKTRNDLGQGLANGDTGVVVRVDEGLMFAFRHGDSIVTVPISVDEAVAPAFATTVHKAQGSEYTTVVVVVPPSSSPLNTRELLYTAMTRAKPRAIVVGTRDDIVHAISTRRVRFSGLADRLTP